MGSGRALAPRGAPGSRAAPRGGRGAWPYCLSEGPPGPETVARRRPGQASTPRLAPSHHLPTRCFTPTDVGIWEVNRVPRAGAGAGGLFNSFFGGRGGGGAGRRRRRRPSERPCALCNQSGRGRVLCCGERCVQLYSGACVVGEGSVARLSFFSTPHPARLSARCRMAGRRARGRALRASRAGVCGLAAHPSDPPPPLVSLFPAVDAPPPPPCRRPVDTMSSAGLPGPLPTSRAGGMGAPAPPPRAARPKSPSPRGPPLSCLIPPTATSMACPLPAVAPPPQPGARVRSATVAFPSKRCAPAPAPVAPWTTMPPTEGWRDGQYWALAEVREMGAGALGAPGESRGARGSRAGGAPRDTGQQKGGPD